ncbi:MAG: Fe-S protein assembly co-chaperone HscB [Saprospiraceae bacterium]|nr:Fe-S protein assembly co-chaperone HscB [Saprospiraceae bacterium]
MNHFEFFNIPVSFYPDLVDLKQRYLKNSKLFHPDFHTLAEAEKQAETESQSTHNNEAYQVLADFDKRLKYILELKGMLEENKHEIPQEFLLEMMDVNEAIMELEFDFDEAMYQKAIQDATELETSLLAAVQPVMESYVDGVTPSESLAPVVDFFLKRRYLWRIKENLNKFAPASKEVR